jgi:hypothetical protein
MNQLRVSFFGYFICGAVLLLAACASSQQISPQATSKLTQVRVQALELKQQVSRTSASARALENSSDSNLGHSIGAFSDNLNSLNSTLVGGRQAVVAASEQAATYLADWDKQTSGMSADMKQVSEKRRAEAQASFDALHTSIGDVRTNLKPYMSELNEVSQYLHTDQTMAGVNAVSPRLTSALDREPAIQKDLDKVIAQIDAMQGVKNKY